jgi:hypothetical protein
MMRQQQRAATLNTKYRQQQKQRAAHKYEEEAKLVFRRSSFGRNNTGDSDSGSIWPRSPKPTAQLFHHRLTATPPTKSPLLRTTTDHDHDTHTSYPSLYQLPATFPLSF